MLLTEEQARNKWCPHARMTDDHSEASGGNNRWLGVKGQENCNCIASDCMAWRWADAEPQYRRHRVTDTRFIERRAAVDALPDEEWEQAFNALEAEVEAFRSTWQPESPVPGAELERISANDEGAHEVVATFREIIRHRRGYCGAFGKPAD